MYLQNRQVTKGLDKNILEMWTVVNAECRVATGLEADKNKSYCCKDDDVNSTNDDNDEIDKINYDGHDYAC